jgi:hypothetical protein
VAQHLGQRAPVLQAHQLDLDPRLSQALPQVGVVARYAVAAAALARHGDQVVDEDAMDDHLPRVRAALVAERRLRDRPALVELADEMRARDAHVFEEYLVELLVAGHLLERPHGESRALHVEDEEADALRLRRVG